MTSRAWRVRGYRGKNRDVVLGETFVRSSSYRMAQTTGERALRILFPNKCKGSFQVFASEYHPELDSLYVGYVAKETA